jgi:sec-independent protein translocase protein TatA
MGLENPVHIAILLIVVLLVFGAKRLPELGHSLGSGLRGFKDALSADGPHPSLAATQPSEEPIRANVTAESAPVAPVHGGLESGS